MPVSMKSRLPFSAKAVDYIVNWRLSSIPPPKKTLLCARTTDTDTVEVKCRFSILPTAANRHRQWLKYNGT